MHSNTLYYELFQGHVELTLNFLLLEIRYPDIYPCLILLLLYQKIFKCFRNEKYFSFPRNKITSVLPV